MRRRDDNRTLYIIAACLAVAVLLALADRADAQPACETISVRFTPDRPYQGGQLTAPVVWDANGDGPTLDGTDQVLVRVELVEGASAWFRLPDHGAVWLRYLGVWYRVDEPASGVTETTVLLDRPDHGSWRVACGPTPQPPFVAPPEPTPEPPLIDTTATGTDVPPPSQPATPVDVPRLAYTGVEDVVLWVLAAGLLVLVGVFLTRVRKEMMRR